MKRPRWSDVALGLLVVLLAAAFVIWVDITANAQRVVRHLEQHQVSGP